MKSNSSDREFPPTQEVNNPGVQGGAQQPYGGSYQQPYGNQPYQQSVQQPYGAGQYQQPYGGSYQQPYGNQPYQQSVQQTYGAGQYQQPYGSSYQQPYGNQPYQQSVQPSSYEGSYRQSYGASQQPQKKNNLLIPLVAAGCVVAIVAVLAILMIVSPPVELTSELLSYDKYKSYEADARALIVDGRDIDLSQSMINWNDTSYVNAEDIADVFGYKTTFDAENMQTVLSKDSKEIIFTYGEEDMIIQDTASGQKKSVKLDGKLLMFTNAQTYIPLKSMQTAFNFKSIDWDESTETVSIVTDGVTVPVN